MVNKPWDREVNLSGVFAAAAISDFERAEIIVYMLTSLGIEDVQFNNLLFDLDTAQDKDEFEYVWNRIYDWADKGKRLWIQT